jgi:copper chaperone CopZ
MKPGENRLSYLVIYNTSTMKTLKIFLVLLFISSGYFAGAQQTAKIERISLQASGLTCSMCSKAVKLALEEVPFVAKVMVDIKNQQYNLTFRDGAVIDLDQLGKAVEDAGFSVAALKVTANLDGLEVGKDEHVQIGNHYFHFLNGDSKKLSGKTSFSVVDKNFVPAKEFQKYSSMSTLACVQTGKASSCCTAEAVPAEARIYHVIL